MYQTLKGNGLEDLSIDYVINWCDKLDSNGYVMIDDYSMLYKSSANLKDIARELLDDMLDDAIHVDSLIDKDSLAEYWIEQTSKEEVIDDLIRPANNSQVKYKKIILIKNCMTNKPFQNTNDYKIWIF